jgi:hypothetical protein
MKKSNRKFVWIGLGLFLIVLIGAIILVTSLTKESVVGGSNYIEVPFYGTVQCSPATGYSINTPSYTVGVNGQFVTPPVSSKQYDVLVSYPKQSILSLERRVEYYYCDSTSYSNCQSPSYLSLGNPVSNDIVDRQLITNIPGNKYLFVQVQEKTISGWKGNSQGSVKIKFIPYILWRQDSLQGGLNPISGSTDCSINSNDKSILNAIISSTVSDSSGKSAVTSNIPDALNGRLQPSEVYNYISGTVTRLDQGSIINYLNQEGYCQQNLQGGEVKIFGFGEITTPSNTYKVVDLNKVVANLGTDGCCVLGQQQLNKVCTNYKWEEVKVDTETGETNVGCSILKPCNPGRFVLDNNQKTSYEYKCVDSKCVVSNIQNEECTSTSQCGANQVCTNFKCMLASSTTGTVDANITGEVPQCKFYQDSYVTSQRVCTGLLGLSDCKEAPKSGCTTSAWVTWVIVILTISVIIGIVILFKKLFKNKGA